MAYQKGSDMLLKVDTNGSGSYSTVGAMQTKSISISNDLVDVTNQDSTNKWRELLAGAGIKKASLSGRGVFNDGAAENTVLTYCLAGTIRNWQCIVPGLGTFQGLMQVSQCEYSGQHDKEVQYDIRIESAGEITFSAS